MRSAARRSTHSPIWHDKPGLLGERNESARRRQPFRRAPAHQRLDAEHPADRQLNQRLELQIRIRRARARACSADLHLQPLARLDHVARLVEPHAAAGFLGDIERGFGLLHQRCRHRTRRARTRSRRYRRRYRPWRRWRTRRAAPFRAISSRAKASASSRLAQDCRRIANSSAPMRASMSLAPSLA